MLIIFGLGIMVGIVAVVDMIRLTITTEPTGCAVVFDLVLC